VIGALLLTIVTTVVALIIALAFSVSTTANTAGISAVAGGFSGSVFILLIAASPLLFMILFLVFRKLLQRKGW
jgi:hypothetical protein